MVGRGTRRQQEIQVGHGGRAHAGVSRRWRIRDRVDGLAGPVDAGTRQLLAGRLPEIGDGSFLPDQHPRARLAGEIGERAATGARRHDVAAQVAERRQRLVLVGEGGEAPLRAPGDVLEEHALDRRLRAVAEDLVDRRLDQAGAHGRNSMQLSAGRVAEA